MKIWRVAGIVLMAGLALFLLTLLLKLLLVAGITFLLVRVVGGQIASRAFGRMERGGGRSNDIIAIDNPTYRTSMYQPAYGRVIPIG